MTPDHLIRAADAVVLALLWLMAGAGVVLMTATGQLFALAVALAFVLEGAQLALRVLRP